MKTKFKKILYIIPPYFDVLSDPTIEISAAIPVFTIPYGILSIDAYTKSKSINHIESTLLDLNLISCNKSKFGKDCLLDMELSIEKMVISFKPDIVAISALFDTCYNYLSLISEVVKHNSPSALIVIGGGLSTNLANIILKDFPSIDAACYAEGEIPMKDLLDADNYFTFLENHPSWLTYPDIAKNKSLTASFIENLDELPILNYDLINLANYNGRSLDKCFDTLTTKRELSIHTSRGCPFKCVFCSNSKVHGKKVRFMSVERVIDEVEIMKSRYGLTTLLIEDDNFLINKKRAKHILQELSKFNLRLEFPNGIAVYAIDEEMGNLLKKAGATTIPLAVESGSDYVLKNIINKPLNTKMIKNAVDILKKNKLTVHSFIVIGLPGEMDFHRNQTLKMIANVGFDWVYFFIATPITGSRLYDMCIENNYLINNDFKNHLVSKANIRAPGVDPKKIEETAYQMNLKINFVENYNMKQGDHEKASCYFESIVNRYPNHAFAHYYLSETYKHLKKKQQSIKYHKKEFYKLVNTDNQWRHYAVIFKIHPDPKKDFVEVI